MNDALIIKYSIGVGIALACFVGFVAVSLFHDKKKNVVEILLFILAKPSSFVV